MSKKEVAKRNVGLAKGGVKGFESTDKELLEIPRLKIAQALTEEVQEGEAKQGQIINSLTGEILADKEKEVLFTPLIFGKSRIFFERPNGVKCIAKNGMEGQGDPGGTCADCPYSKWTKDEKDKNVQLCSELLNFVSIINEVPIMVSFMKTGFKAGKKLYNLIASQAMKGNSPWFNKYSISTKFKTGDDGSYYIPVIKAAGKNDEESIEYFDNLFDMLSNVDISVEYEDEAPPVDNSAAEMANDTDDNISEEAPWERTQNARKTLKFAFYGLFTIARVLARKIGRLCRQPWRTLA